jgi:hypothetical protein
VSRGLFDPDEMTDVQRAFWIGLTDQRIANIWEASDYIADLSQEAKDLLRNADKKTLRWLERASAEDIDQLQSSIKFMEASRLVGRIVWWLTAALFGSVITFLAFWERVSALVRGTKT